MTTYIGGTGNGVSTTIVIDSELWSENKQEQDAQTIFNLLYLKVPSKVFWGVYKLMKDYVASGKCSDGYKEAEEKMDEVDLKYNRSAVLYNIQALAEAQRASGWPESWINRDALCRDLDAAGLGVLSGPIKREVGWDAIEALVNAILDTE